MSFNFPAPAAAKPVTLLNSSATVLLSVYIRQLAPSFQTVFDADWRAELDAPAGLVPAYLDFDPPTDRHAVRMAVRTVLEARPDFWLWRKSIVRIAARNRIGRLHAAPASPKRQITASSSRVVNGTG